jgi:hypothetical protein
MCDVPAGFPSCRRISNSGSSLTRWCRRRVRRLSLSSLDGWDRGGVKKFEVVVTIVQEILPLRQEGTMAKPLFELHIPRSKDYSCFWD